jgi:hypothetical protein
MTALPEGSAASRKLSRRTNHRSTAVRNPGTRATDGCLRIDGKLDRQMQIDTVLSTAMLAALLWSLRFLLPKAIKEHDRFVLVCALLTAALALIAWMFFGTGITS